MLIRHFDRTVLKGARRRMNAQKCLLRHISQPISGFSALSTWHAVLRTRLSTKNEVPAIMPVSAVDLQRVIAVLADEDELKVTMKSSAYGGVVAGVATAAVGGACRRSVLAF